MITIIDYGVGNLGSVYNMLRKIGVEAEVTSDPQRIEKAQKILLPGVGAFDYAMKSLIDSELLATLNEKALVQKVPVLGICLGMQLMTRGSEEGKLPGLGWIDGQAYKFTSPGIKVPHMGWN